MVYLVQNQKKMALADNLDLHDFDGEEVNVVDEQGDASRMMVGEQPTGHSETLRGDAGGAAERDIQAPVGKGEHEKVHQCLLHLEKIDSDIRLKPRPFTMPSLVIARSFPSWTYVPRTVPRSFEVAVQIAALGRELASIASPNSSAGFNHRFPVFICSAVLASSPMRYLVRQFCTVSRQPRESRMKSRNTLL